MFVNTVPQAHRFTEFTIPSCPINLGKMATDKTVQHYELFLKLKVDPDYREVIYDERTNGVSAIHYLHRFDKKIGPFGYKRGDYELRVLRVLRENGCGVLLLPETQSITSLKSPDCWLDGDAAEIKTVEGRGRWAVRPKIYAAAKQRAEVVILFCPSKHLFSLERIVEGWRMYDDVRLTHNNWPDVKRIISVVEDRLVYILKPPG